MMKLLGEDARKPDPFQWYRVLSVLAKHDATKFDEVSKLNHVFAFNHLSFLKKEKEALEG